MISTLKSSGERPLSVSGYENSEWIVIDYGDVVVHLFYEPTRHYYEFDELWKLAEPLALEPQTQERADRLKTGLFL